MRYLRRCMAMAIILVMIGSAPGLAHKGHDIGAGPGRPAAPAEHPSAQQDAQPARGTHNMPMDGHGMTAPDADQTEIGAHAERAAIAQTKPFGQRLLDWLGRWHTASVHIPIGLIIGALLAELVGHWRRDPTYRPIARFMLAIGAVGAVGAAVLGWLDAGFHLSDQNGVLMTHRWLGSLIALVAVALAYLSTQKRSPERPRVAYWTLLIATVSALAVQGFLGGALVHGGLDHLAF